MLVGGAGGWCAVWQGWDQSLSVCARLGPRLRAPHCTVTFSRSARAPLTAPTAQPTTRPGTNINHLSCFRCKYDRSLHKVHQWNVPLPYLKLNLIF